jgi:hypothetical protein
MRCVGAHKNAGRFTLKPYRIDADVIVIPPEFHRFPITELEISARLHNVLVSNHLRYLGDLHGLLFYRIGGLNNCGRKCILELRDLVRGMQNDENFFRPQPCRRTYFISIPAEAYELSPYDLPISARLASVLRYMDVQTLADLDGMGSFDLLKIKNCGRITLRELANLLKRVETGEFQPSAENFSPPALADLICLLDRLIMDLSPRDREVLLLRFGAFTAEMQTLAVIAAKLQISLERIRQIIKKSLATLTKASGPKLIAYLHGIADLCHQLEFRLTPTLLAQWVDRYSVQHQFPLTFYVRLLGQMNHNIPPGKLS